MKTKFKKNGRRLLAAILCLVMAVMALPMSAFAWTSEEGVSCTSSFGDYYVGSDGGYYRSKSSYSFIVYDSDGNTSVRTISAGNAKRKYLMTDSSGTHQVYCVESGIDFMLLYLKVCNGCLKDTGATTRDQRMMFAVLTMVHTADSKEQLDSDTEALLTTARKHLCQFAVLKYQQMDGLNTVLPFGVRKIDALRTLTTESLAVFIPFRVQEIYHENGVYYGQNVISKNMIIANRRHLLNGNSFILGVSGAGKSFTAKEEMTNIILTDPNADIIIIDPEREYSPLVKAMQGEVIHISATSENHINAMDMNSDYGDGANPVILKSEFILSLCEQLIGGSSLGAKQKSIIDRCTASV